jgi:hypothetical protein
MFRRLIDAVFGPDDADESGQYSKQPRERIITPATSYDSSAYAYGHYTDALEQVKQLKRERRHDPVEDLLLWCIEFAETEARDPSVVSDVPPPAWYRHLGIVYRKDDRYADEVALLERYLQACQQLSGDPDEDLVDRLDRARELTAGD